MERVLSRFKTLKNTLKEPIHDLISSYIHIVFCNMTSKVFSDIYTHFKNKLIKSAAIP